MFKKIAIILAIVIISGLSGIAADRYLFPYLISTRVFSKYDFLKKSAENVTVINKTEQIYVKEETSAEKVAGSGASSVVNIISYLSPEASPGAKPGYKNGTGIIATSDGLIMTYASALNINPAVPYKYKVMASDGNVYDAEIFGTDSWSGLVFLKINASNLPVVSFGNSDDARSGEKVVAIGNSLENYGNRYFSGLLSGFNATFNLGGKTLSVPEKMEGVFETDFDLGGAFVGGPVLDYSGRMIGVVGSVEKNGQIVYFEIPSNKVKNVLEKALRKELDQNPILGAYYVPLTKTYALANGISRETGALIFSPSGQNGLAVIAGSPAQKAGLRLADIITAINGEEITLKNNLAEILYKHKKGEEIELAVTREGNEMAVKVVL
ncbi:MAG: hypothetical protein A2288_01520 [Candidatus Moranbacteria bacterium RIFOXYA12_FULL_44_15]|nr:MAG: hypothetical protein A2288_01520 [Candidatus Moranbacteria bacterium RIFOXYA12_FULL_44_15]OGI35643.1 MAG: hypothetical protein A2259_01420 [Candidatus Moranbacteria bacterium RIFOXYA2_FULL_43_15]